MAGVDFGGGTGKRRSVDSEINMIPMIDLLMVTVSFLLITAVWTHTARLNADAQVPGPTRIDVEPPSASEKVLHIHMTSTGKFTLLWKQGNTTIDSVDVPRRSEIAQEGEARVVRFPDLASKLESEWRAKGQHASPADRKFDQAVLHTDNETEFASLVGAIDAVYRPRRDVRVGAKTEKTPAFNLTFAAD